MDKLGCPLCDSELTKLPKDHPEYFRSIQIRDGTNLWLSCSNKECAAVFVKDKLRSTWNYSPQTYTNLVKKKIIKDRLA